MEYNISIYIMFGNLVKSNYFDCLVKEASNNIIKEDRLSYKPILDLIMNNINNNEKIQDLFDKSEYWV